MGELMKGGVVSVPHNDEQEGEGKLSAWRGKIVPATASKLWYTT